VRCDARYPQRHVDGHAIEDGIDHVAGRGGGHVRAVAIEVAAIARALAGEVVDAEQLVVAAHRRLRAQAVQAAARIGVVVTVVAAVGE